MSEAENRSLGKTVDRLLVPMIFINHLSAWKRAYMEGASEQDAEESAWT
jgi:hypothetical protein